MSEAAVEVRGVSRVFPLGVKALDGVDLAVRRGEFIAVMGPSGSGKTTLLNLIAGLDRPTAGEVFVDGVALSGLDDDALAAMRRRRLGIVFQAFNLVDVLTASENAALPLVLDGVAEGEAHARAAEALEWVGLGARADHLPAELSGGEQQRVAIARAIAIRPVLLLADEPTGNLDTAAGDGVLGLLRRLSEERGQTLLLVTHDARHAARAGRLLRLRDGKVVEEQTLGGGGRPLREVLGGEEGDVG